MQLIKWILNNKKDQSKQKAQITVEMHAIIIKEGSFMSIKTQKIVSVHFTTIYQDNYN